MSDSQVIPEAAVEAAASAIAEADHLWPDCAWEDAPDNLRDEARAMAGCALEAAAPHMLAAAWEKGWTAREDLHAYDVWGGGCEEPDSSNPYRPTP